MTDAAVTRLRDLIDYVEAAERDRLRVVLDVADHRGFRWAGNDVAALPGVSLNLAGDDGPLWASVQRLARGTPPPVEDRELRLWVTLGDDPDEAPALRSEADGEALRAAHLIEPQEGKAGGRAPATVKLANYPHRERLEAALAGYRRELWEPWARDERPRRRAIALYNGLFALRQALDGGGEQPIELVCGIGMARWTRPRGALRYPLLSVPLEVAINAETHAIEVRPRSEAPAAIESDALDMLEAPSVEEWRRFARAQIDGAGGALSPFDADLFAPILRRAVALLDPDGRYLPDHDGATAAGDGLQIDGSWLLFEHARRGTQVMDDLRRFRDALEAEDAGASLPDAVRALVTDPAELAREDARQTWRGVSTIPGTTSSDGSGADLFFPKPFNAEQVEVIQRLSARPGVVVQGPPGTGKTHTIANVVSHYLALGKRVLVTSQKAPALKVVRAQLPPALRPLAVSLLDSDREGLKQFEQSVETIAERLHRSRPADLRREIDAVSARIDALHRRLADLDRAIERVGRTALSPVELDSETVEPASAARAVVVAGALAAWIEDPLDTIRSHDPEFGDGDIAALRNARLRLGNRLAYLGAALPDPGVFPAPEAVAQIHDDLVERATLEGALDPRDRLVDAGGPDQLAAAADLLGEVTQLRTGIAASHYGWTDAILARFRVEQHDPAAAAFASLRERVEACAAEALHFLTLPVDLPAGSLHDRPLREMIGGLAAGEQPGLFSALFARVTLQRLAEVRLCARAPAGAAEWREVERYLSGCDAADALRAAWNHAAGRLGLDPVEESGLDAAAAMRRQLDMLDRIAATVRAESEAERMLAQLFPGHAASSIRDHAALANASALVERHRRRLRLARALQQQAALASSVRDLPGEVGIEMRALIDRIGKHDESGEALARRWSDMLGELSAIRALGVEFATVARVAAAIEESGAPRWAKRLVREPATGVQDPLTPGDWRERWRLRRLATWLDRIDAHDQLRTLARERGDAERQLARSYEQAIELRTWCGLAEQASDQVRSALAAYGQAVRRLGQGTGIRAGRYRADARAAADRAKSVLPCWIMPHYRVSESLPAEFGLFDLVIIDEASQSTIGALPALLRARQVLIVGDDKQVSPDAGFREEARANQLATRFLGSQVGDFREAMREEKSLYDLGSVVFAGGAIMLREHFRCVAPIIEFSKAQFYDHKLIPLRLPAASERIDPPLVDILVEDGYRRGKINRPEVECIVDEIRRIAEDPTLAGRSVGVTTLLGQEQAAELHKMIERELGPELMMRHDVRVGEPSVFQGDERDIMFVSMVADRDSAPLVGRGYEQRFNVAASRARDRMVLVRSVEIEDLRPADGLRRALIEHFRAPFAGDPDAASERRQRCESAFEEEMFDRLTDRGYRVDTQVRVGTKRIDLVVEGGQDRRLAIECDGDRYHGPDRWPDDMARQRLLERAGWTVWRCFASRFVREPDRVMDELVAVLRERGIEPERGGAASPERLVEQRRWRSAEPQDDAAAAPVPHAWLVPAVPFDADPAAVAAE